MKLQIKWFAAIIFFAILFCASFVYFYTKQQIEKNSPTSGVEKNSEKPLPEAKLISHDSEILFDDKIRKGKVILIFISPSCEACVLESDFLRSLIRKRSDISFYGVVSFGNFHDVLESAEKKFSFPVYYDGDSMLALKLGIIKVPIKIYLEDGVIKKVWGGATVSEEKKFEFINWLENI